jgi:RNA polymerase sigma-70 factor (ECF subfamily)
MGPLQYESDESLAARAGFDGDAMTELYLRYNQKLFGYCNKRVQFAEHAWDLVSDIFLKVLVDLQKGSEIMRFRAWLFTIAHNVVVNSYRHRYTETPLENHEMTADDRPSPEEIVFRNLDSEHLHSLMARLKNDQREVLELKLAGLTIPEICHVLGKSYSWVTSTLHRAMKQLKKLGDEDEKVGGRE